jgi:hypothetical protein
MLSLPQASSSFDSQTSLGDAEGRARIVHDR